MNKKTSMAKSLRLKVFEDCLKAEGPFFITEELSMPFCFLPIAIHLLPFASCPTGS